MQGSLCIYRILANVSCIHEQCLTHQPNTGTNVNKDLKKPYIAPTKVRQDQAAIRDLPAVTAHSKYLCSPLSANFAFYFFRQSSSLQLDNLSCGGPEFAACHCHSAGIQLSDVIRGKIRLASEPIE